MLAPLAAAWEAGHGHSRGICWRRRSILRYCAEKPVRRHLQVYAQHRGPPAVTQWYEHGCEQCVGLVEFACQSWVGQQALGAERNLGSASAGLLCNGLCALYAAETVAGGSWGGGTARVRVCMGACVQLAACWPVLPAFAASRQAGRLEDAMWPNGTAHVNFLQAEQWSFLASAVCAKAGKDTCKCWGSEIWTLELSSF